MGLEGNLMDFGLEAIFQLINSEKKTGTLHIIRKADSAEGFVYFRAGRIFGAVSNYNRQPLGERLVNAGHISEGQLRHALEVQRGDGKQRRKLGQILISEGLITQQILRTFVKEQIQNTVFDLMPWVDGDFRFLEDKLPASEDMGLMLSARKILSQGSARLDEWERIRGRVSSAQAVFETTAEARQHAESGEFSPLHTKILDLLDGRSSVADLAESLGISEFDVSSHLFDLAEAGLAGSVDLPAGEGEDQALSHEELELSPDDIITDRAHYMTELVVLTDPNRRAQKGRVFLPLVDGALLSERVHLDRKIEPAVFQRLIDSVKEL
jgi:DNA-binding transcriptional ArsR family regulator